MQSQQYPRTDSFGAVVRNVFFVGLCASLGFSVLGYETVSSQLGNPLVTDGYDLLARGLVEFGTLSYYPDPSPTVLRTPLYPLMLAGSMLLGGKHFVMIALLMQSCLHGVTCTLVALIAFQLSNKKGGKLAGYLCAIHPLLIWYASRLVVETMSTFIFTTVVLVAVQFWQKPKPLRAVVLGFALGAGLWCKAVFAPLLIAFPIIVLFTKGEWVVRSLLLAAMAIALLVIAPWIMRNHQLTDHWPILQSLLGYNLYVGDSFVENAGLSPLGYVDLIKHTKLDGMEQALIRGDALRSRAMIEAERDISLVRRSTEHYRSDPLFLIKKVAFNSIWFWILASSWRVTLFIALIQVPLLFYCALGVRRFVSGKGWSSGQLLPIWIGVAYLLPHLLTFSLGRFSVPLVPAFLAFAVASFVDHRTNSETL